jgi:hypothetical protein
MGVVVPVSKFAEILEMPDAKEARDKLRQMQEQAAAFDPETVSPPANGGNRTQRNDFNSQLNKAAKPNKVQWAALIA